MGKKNRDSGSSRETTRDAPRRDYGGVRNAGVVKTVSQNLNRQRAYQRAELPELDLSAFEPTDNIASAFDIAPAQLLRPAQFYSPGAGRDRVAEAPRAKLATPKLLARTQAKQQPGRAAILPVRKPGFTNTALVNQSLTARTDHLQAKPSEKRKERSRENCKQRPEPKKSGSGSSRAFVPWCDRKR